MITHDDLITAGFRRYPASANLDKGPLYQKRYEVRYEDPDGRPLYFLNVTEYDFSAIDPRVADSHRWAADAHLYFSEDRFAAISYCIRADSTLEEVEAFYQRAFGALGCIGDPHND